MASLSFHLFPYQSVFRNDYYDLSQIKVKTGQNDSYKQFVMLQPIIPFSTTKTATFSKTINALEWSHSTGAN